MVWGADSEAGTVFAAKVAFEVGADVGVKGLDDGFEDALLKSVEVQGICGLRLARFLVNADVWDADGSRPSCDFGNVFYQCRQSCSSIFLVAQFDNEADMLRQLARMLDITPYELRRSMMVQQNGMHPVLDRPVSFPEP